MFVATCVCGWSLERDERAANLPRENNQEITRKVAEAHRDRPRFGESAEEKHAIEVSDNSNTSE